MNVLQRRPWDRRAPVILEICDLPEDVSRRHIVSHRVVEPESGIAAPGDDRATPERFLTDDRTLTIFRDASIVAEYGLIVLPGGILVEDSLLKVRKKVRLGKLNRRRRRLVVNSPVFCMKVYSNYYHFWRECLVPMLMLRENEVLELGDLTIAITRPLEDWQEKALRCLVPEGTRLLRVDSNAEIRAKLAVLPSVHRSTAFSPRVVEDLRSLVDQLIADREIEQSRSAVARDSVGLYISRQRATRRRPTNEKLLIASLERRGISAVVLEELDPRDGLALFKNARLVIGQHGAGLTNMIASPGAASVLELHSVDASVAPNHYRALAASLGLNYTGFSGPAEDYNADLELPVPAILDWVDRCILDPTADHQGG